MRRVMGADSHVKTAMLLRQPLLYNILGARDAWHGTEDGEG